MRLNIFLYVYWAPRFFCDENIKTYFPQFSIELCVSCLLCRSSFISGYKLFVNYVLQISSPSSWLVFNEQVLFVCLMQLNILIFLFWAYVLKILFKKSFPTLRSWRYYPVLLSKSFIVLPYTFMYLIHLKLIWGYGIR